jgi:rare lipoprotein A
MKSYFAQIHSALKLLFATALLVLVSDLAGAEVASIYGGRDGLCGHPTANGERLNCADLTAAHRTFAFGTRVRVCHSGCVTVRINDRGPWVRGRHIDLSPAAARANRALTDRARHHDRRYSKRHTKCGGRGEYR